MTNCLGPVAFDRLVVVAVVALHCRHPRDVSIYVSLTADLPSRHVVDKESVQLGFRAASYHHFDVVDDDDVDDVAGRPHFFDDPLVFFFHRCYALAVYDDDARETVLQTDVHSYYLNTGCW